MPQNKTVETDLKPADFIAGLESQQVIKDCRKLSKMMRSATGKNARMWGSSIVGFGKYQYKYASGHGGEFFLTGYSPRKNNFSIYIMPGFSDYQNHLKDLGKHKLGKSCLYVKQLNDIDFDLLTFIVTDSVSVMRNRYGC